MLAACLIHASRAVAGLHRVLDAPGCFYSGSSFRERSEAADERRTAE